MTMYSLGFLLLATVLSDLYLVVTLCKLKIDDIRAHNTSQTQSAVKISGETHSFLHLCTVYSKCVVLTYGNE